MESSTRLIRSPARKRTVALNVETDGSVRIVAPVRTPLKWIESFLASKAGWIARRRAELERKRQEKPAPLAEGSRVLFQGRHLRLSLRLCDEPDTLCLKLPCAATPDLMAEEIRTELTLWYKKQARRVFRERFDYWAGQMNAKAQRMALSSPQKRWGSCSASDSIRLNWRLIMAPQELLDYVIVHELAHITHKNHSPRFWRRVEMFMPDWKERRHALRLFEKDPIASSF